MVRPRVRFKSADEEKVAIRAANYCLDNLLPAEDLQQFLYQLGIMDDPKAKPWQNPRKGKSRKKKSNG